MILRGPDPDELRRLTPSQQASYWRARCDELAARMESLEVLYEQACRDRDHLRFRLGGFPAEPSKSLPAPPGEATPLGSTRGGAGAKDRAATPTADLERPTKPLDVIEPQVIFDEGAKLPPPPFRLGEYTLYSKRSREKGGAGTRTVYFFSNEARPGGTPCVMPAGFEVQVDPSTRVPFLRELPKEGQSKGKDR